MPCRFRREVHWFVRLPRGPARDAHGAWHPGSGSRVSAPELRPARVRVPAGAEESKKVIAGARPRVGHSASPPA